jgi:hypothetical protein
MSPEGERSANSAGASAAKAPPDEAKQMQQFIEPARAARICINAETTQWTAAMRKKRALPDGLANGSYPTFAAFAVREKERH